MYYESQKKKMSQEVMEVRVVVTWKRVTCTDSRGTKETFWDDAKFTLIWVVHRCRHV